MPNPNKKPVAIPSVLAGYKIEMRKHDEEAVELEIRVLEGIEWSRWYYIHSSDEEKMLAEKEIFDKRYPEIALEFFRMYMSKLPKTRIGNDVIVDFDGVPVRAWYDKNGELMYSLEDFAKIFGTTYEEIAQLLQETGNASFIKHRYHDV